jgi:hypothetical protein
LATDAESQATSDGPTYFLTVTLPAAVDHDAGVRTLGKVYDTLTSYTGNDRFTLMLARANGLVELEFPNSNTRYCVGLLDTLKGLIGDGRVDVAIR